MNSVQLCKILLINQLIKKTETPSRPWNGQNCDKGFSLYLTNEANVLPLLAKEPRASLTPSKLINCLILWGKALYIGVR
jgi:hypothetical protein